MNIFNPAAIAAETQWLLDHPHFDQKPASIREFVGPGYLDIEKKVRPGLMKALTDIFGEEVNGNRIAHFEQAMITGGIGIGKTTFASIALPYMCHWTLCLRDPQDFFELLPGSRIAFMQMSTSEDQARNVIFGDIKARIEHSDWFVQNYPHDDKYTKVIKFPKDIWILPGDSAETTFEGYNILAGILDEMDSHKVTKDKDYAEQGFNTIESRISSRFIDPQTDGHKGLLICIGQMKKGNGFAAKKYADMKKDPKAYVMRMAIWESLGWERWTDDNGERKSFFYDTKRKTIIPKGVAGMVQNEDLIEIPLAYEGPFRNAPEKALRDLAGIPPLTSDPFISLTHKIDACRDKYVERVGAKSPVKPDTQRAIFEPWFRANGDPRRRAVHLDIAYSADGDAAGIAMGHIERLVEIEGENLPYIVIDCMIRLKAAPGTEIMIADLRRIIYDLKDERGFKIVDVTMDGFQSTDTMQQLRKRKFKVDYLSVDKSTLPYEDLREAIYQDRLEFPAYETYINKGDVSLVEIAVQELQQLTDTGKKIDHPPSGSKDVADTLAGVVSTLMGDRGYRKGVASPPRSDNTLLDDWNPGGPQDAVTSFAGAGDGLRAPIPQSTGGMFGLTIPQRLLP